MMKNNKAISPLLALIAIIVIIVVIVAVAFALGNTPTVAASDVTVYIDSVKQDVNYTQTQTLNWGNVVAGNVYTKNFTVTNTGTQNLTLMLLTTEPLGTTQTWAYNNSLLPPSTMASGSLTLTLSTNPSPGTYTWRLLATNNTATAQPTPTPTASSDPTANYMLTLNLTEDGIAKINITLGSENPFILTPDDTLPRTYSFKSGTTIKIETVPLEGYEFNTYILGDGVTKTSNPATFTSQKADLTITPYLRETLD